MHVGICELYTEATDKFVIILQQILSFIGEDLYIQCWAMKEISNTLAISLHQAVVWI